MKSIYNLLGHSLLLVLLLAISGSGLPAQDNEHIALVGQWAEGACYATYLDEDVALMNNGCYVIFIDVSDPNLPHELSRVLTPAFVNSITVHDDIAYIGSDERGLTILDISDPADPRELSFVDIPGFHAEVEYHDGHIFYVTNSSQALTIIDVSAPSLPMIVGELDFHSRSKVAIQGEYLFVAARWDGLRLYSIEDISNPIELDSLDGLYCNDVIIDQDYLYAMAYDSMVVYDITVPDAPVYVSTFLPEFGSINACMVNDGIAFTAERTRLRITDVSDPSTPVTLSTISGETGFILDIYIGDTLAVLASNHNGIRIVNITDHMAPELAGSHDSGGSAYGVAISGDRAYLADGYDGLRIFDVTNLATPVLLGDFPTLNNAYKVEIIDQYAYVANSSGGVLVLDVSDPTSPEEVTSLNISDAAVRNITREGSFLYVAHDKGFEIISIVNPASPFVVDSMRTEDRVFDIAVQSGLIVTAQYQDGVKLYLRLPFTLDLVEFGSIEDIGRIQSVAISGNYVYAGMNNPYVRVIDASDPDDMVVIDEVFTSRAYELEISEDKLYVSGGYSGVSIYDISDPFELEEIGYYDTGGEVYDIALAENDTFLVADYNAGMAIFSFDQTSATRGAWRSSDASIEILNVYPNPSEGPLSIIFQATRAQNIAMRIFDSSGRLVDVLMNTYLQPGTYTQSWDGDIPGSYFIEVQGDKGRVLAPIVIQ